MRVTLLNHTPEPELQVARAARLCVAWEYPWDMSLEEARSLNSRLLKAGHTSPFEHAYFTFLVEGLSRAALQQLVRHRIASYSVSSNRRGKFRSHPVWSDFAPQDAASKTKLDLIYAWYSELCQTDPETARYLLPEAATVNLVFTINARSLHNFLRLRCSRAASKEIRHLAMEICNLVQQVAPSLLYKCEVCHK